MNKTNIEWCDYTWNPVVGCKRGCAYCYAKKINDIFNPLIPFNSIVYHTKRLKEKMPKKPSKIFVGSMSDIEYWNKEFIQMIINIAKSNPIHTFMFLSKSPYSYDGFSWPMNTMQGLTIELTQTPECQYQRSFHMLNFHRPFLSIEPLMGIMHKIPTSFEKVIVGAMTGPGALAPKKEWIQSVKDKVSADKLFWKSNIKAYL